MTKQSRYIGFSIGAGWALSALHACAGDTAPQTSTPEASSQIAALADSCNSGVSRPFEQPPINGAAIPIASSGTTAFEAEHFNCGGEGQGYHELTVGNASGTYRSIESVDILDIVPGGRTVQFFDTGEWMAYTINVASTGTYDLAINAASNNPTAGQYRIDIDGTDVTGNVTVPITGSWDMYAWVTRAAVSLAAGQHVLTLVSVQQSFRVDQLRVVAFSSPGCNAGPSRPYTGSPVNGNPIPVPSTFEAEYFDCGGEGLAYHDVVPGVNTGQSFRADNEVEIIDILAAGNGLAINHFDTSEWTTYTVSVPVSGAYNIGILASNSPSTAGPGAFGIEVDGAPASGNVAVPQTTGWEDYQWIDKTGVTLPAGIHTIKLVSAQQSFRIDKLRVTAPGADCSAPDLTLCVQFEANPDTQFGVPDIYHVTTRTLGSMVVWEAQNAAGDSATDMNRLSLVSGGRDGSSAIKLQTLDNDSNVHSSGTSERSEIALDQPTTGATEGVVQWWAHSVLMPADSVFSSVKWEGSSLLQFHGSDGGAPNFMLALLNQGGLNPHPIFRAYTAGDGGVDSIGTQYTYRIDNGASNPIIGQCILDNPAKGVWYDFVHRIKWSYNNQGEHEIWMRQAGGSVTKVLRKTGINTLYLNDSAYLKFGPYHDPVVGANSSIIYDRIRRGTTADAVRMPDFVVDPNATVTMCSGVTSP
jgi:hypothetical protein